MMRQKGENLTNVFSFRLTQDERDVIDSTARLLGMTPSDFGRLAIDGLVGQIARANIDSKTFSIAQQAAGWPEHVELFLQGKIGIEQAVDEAISSLLIESDRLKRLLRNMSEGGK